MSLTFSNKSSQLSLHFYAARAGWIYQIWGLIAKGNNYWEFFLRDSDRSLITYHPYDGELLWGATARMTVTFLKTIGTLGSKDHGGF